MFNPMAHLPGQGETRARNRFEDEKRKCKIMIFIRWEVFENMNEITSLIANEGGLS